jgi:flagellar protein FlgJ
MLETGFDARMAAQSAQQEDLIRFKMQMDDLKHRLGLGPNREKELKDACVKFEAVFINQMWNEMRKTVPKEGYLHSKMEDQYLSMFDQQFSEQMAEDGGIGLADILMDQLKNQVENAANRTLGAGGNAGSEPQTSELQQMAQKEPGDAARLWEQTREEIDPEGSDSEIMRQVNELAERIVREGSTAAQASRRQAAQDYAQAEKIGRQLAVNREKTS